MNVSAAIESALARTIEDHTNFGTEITLRPFQNLGRDEIWDETLDRIMPCIELRASPPAMGSDQVTMRIPTMILIATQNADDRDHRCLRDFYTEVQACLDRLYSQWRGKAPAVEFTTFLDAMAAAVEAELFQFGGFMFEDPQLPFEDRGANVIGITLTTHYSRNDF